MLIRSLGGLQGEGGVSKLCQDDDGLGGAYMWELQVAGRYRFMFHPVDMDLLLGAPVEQLLVLRLDALPLLGSAHAVVVCEQWGGAQRAVLCHLSHIVIAVLLHEEHAVGGGVEMEILVAVQHDGEGGAVALPDVNREGISLVGFAAEHGQQANKRDKYFFHITVF